ncbi:MAG: hypothetical protein ABJ256_13220 [Nisaea sp.]|uniref:hypothetical protein n=1 Tax=Nisaea sp. TaxID=2024842 RepID=UPI003264E0F3
MRKVPSPGLAGVHDCPDILHIRPEAAELHKNSAFAKIGVSRWSDLMRFLTEQLINGAKRQTPCPLCMDLLTQNLLQQNQT